MNVQRTLTLIKYYSQRGRINNPKAQVSTVMAAHCSELQSRGSGKNPKHHQMCGGSSQNVAQNIQEKYGPSFQAPCTSDTNVEILEVAI